jgi:hypothetical protein
MYGFAPGYRAAGEIAADKVKDVESPPDAISQDRTHGDAFELCLKE